MNTGLLRILFMVVAGSVLYSEHIFAARTTHPASPARHNKHVTHITCEKQFDEILAGSKPVVAKFYAPWCGFCQKIASTYVNLAKENPELVFVEIDCDAHKDLALTYKIKSFPTFLFFINGTAQETVLGADENKLKRLIAQYVKQAEKESTQKKEVAEPICKEKPAVVIEPGKVAAIQGKQTLEQLKKTGKHVIAKIGAPWCPACKMVKPFFEDLAKNNGDILFVDIDADTNRELVKEHNVVALPTFLIFESGNNQSPKRISGAAKQELTQAVEALLSKKQAASAEESVEKHKKIKRVRRTKKEEPKKEETPEKPAEKAAPAATEATAPMVTPATTSAPAQTVTVAPAPTPTSAPTPAAAEKPAPAPTATPEPAPAPAPSSAPAPAPAPTVATEEKKA